MFIIGGGVLMLLGFFGLCSVASRSSIFRNFYLLLLLLCFGAAVGVVVLAVLGNWGVDFRGGKCANYGNAGISFEVESIKEKFENNGAFQG